MKEGAFDYIQKPFKLEELELIVQRALDHRMLSVENEYLRTRVGEDEPNYVWGPSKLMRDVYEKILAVAASDATLLLTGESGTGKEGAARTVHHLSARRSCPFLAMNCAALSAGLLESELFGHERGAFTGADRIRKGRFELAESGTLLLDEVSEIDLNLQAKLLRVLQEKVYERVGSSVSRVANVRVIATTNRDLHAEVGRGRFREDLYWRLHVVPIEMPPLRSRKEDIPALGDHILHRLERRGLPVGKISTAALRRFQGYEWPGNVRELANVLERAVVLSRGGEIDEPLVGPWLCGPQGSREDLAGRWAGQPLEHVEREVIQATLKQCAGNREAAARLLGITSRTLRDKLKKWGERISDDMERISGSEG
jgi:DNA-binding NtrC family response regulator